VAALTDEILMAYADGALDAEAGARIAALLRADAGARARVAMFRATGRELSALYEGVLREPVPAHLSQFVMSYGKEREEGPAPEGPAFVPARPTRLARLWTAWQERLIPQSAGWQLAAASAAVLIVGAGAGLFLRGDGGLGPNLAALRPGQLLASGVLHHVLETVPGNEDRVAGSTNGATTVRAVLTFRTKEGGYCREYEVVAPQGQFQGLACRQADGRWAVEAHVAQEAAAAGTHVVAHGEVLDKIAESRMEGDAFSQNEEKAVLRRGWK
jgi:anti-sigma factor RsiW